MSDGISHGPDYRFGIPHNSPEEGDESISVREAAALFAVSAAQILEMLAQGQLRGTYRYGETRIYSR